MSRVTLPIHQLTKSWGERFGVATLGVLELLRLTTGAGSHDKGTSPGTGLPGLDISLRDRRFERDRVRELQAGYQGSLALSFPDLQAWYQALRV